MKTGSTPAAFTLSKGISGRKGYQFDETAPGCLDIGPALMGVVPAGTVRLGIIDRIGVSSGSFDVMDSLR